MTKNDLVKLSRELMCKQREKNNSPNGSLTEIAIRKGKELSKKYNVNEDIVLTSLYLSHSIFSPVWKGEVQKNHPKLSAEFVKPYLDEWDVSDEEKKIILNSIRAHHDKEISKTKTAEVVKNSECFKFVTVEGSLIWFHELGFRGASLEEAAEKVLEKMEQKRSLLTLSDCKIEADDNIKKIVELFKPLVNSI